MDHSGDSHSKETIPCPDLSNWSDLKDRADLEVLVNDVYAKVRADDLLGFIIDEIAGVDWSSHLPKTVDFWETALFRSGAYRGNPLQPHLRLSQQEDRPRVCATEPGSPAGWLGGVEVGVVCYRRGRRVRFRCRAT